MKTRFGTIVTRTLVFVTALGFGPDTAHPKDISSRVVNIVEWDGGRLPPVYERSSQLPLDRDDLIHMNKNGFEPGRIVRMIEERRFVGDASVDGLIELKNAGSTPEVLQAISLHALPPNRSLNLLIELFFEGGSSQARRRYLYVIFPDGPLERIFTADLGAVLSGSWQRDILTDHTDILLPRRIRRITFSGHVPLKTHGEKKALVFTSTMPDIHRSGEIPEYDRMEVREYTFNYPVSSLRSDCTLQVRYRQDSALAYKWHMVRSHIQFEWE